MHTRIAAIIIVAALATACAPRTGYVDMNRAVSECAAGKKVVAEFQAEAAARQRATVQVPLAPKGESDEQWKARLDARGKEASDAILARARVILPGLARASGVSTILSSQGAVYLDPSVDLTDELVRRLDADPKPDPKVAALEAEVASLKQSRKAGP